jgi:elongation factor Ts
MDLKIIKQLRETTGVGILECQKALDESNGDINLAIEILRKQGQKIVEKKQNRVTNSGIIEAYVHSNKKIGVLIELVCETDFVARNSEFLDLAHDLAMQVAAANPHWIKPEDVPVEILSKEKEIASEGVPTDKPESMREKIINGKLEKFYTESCLLDQPFIKEEKIKIKDLIQGKVAKLGENIQVRKFTRFAL